MINFIVKKLLATGFMGKVFLERLLRCTEVAKIYLLLRPKKGIQPKERLMQIFDNAVSLFLFKKIKIIFISY